MSNSMQHHNGNQVCVIDTETTGLDPLWHEIIQICILPLDANLEIRKDVIPFYVDLIPDHPERIDKEAMKVNRLKIAEIGKKGFNRDAAVDMLEGWIKKLGLPCTKYGTSKKIIPLGHNFAFDMGFMKKWLSIDVYNDFFDYHYIDTMIAANYLNDKAAMHAERVPFSKISLTYMCSTLKIKNEKAHDALHDCIATAEVYRKILNLDLF